MKSEALQSKEYSWVISRQHVEPWSNIVVNHYNISLHYKIRINTYKMYRDNNTNVRFGSGGVNGNGGVDGLSGGFSQMPHVASHWVAMESIAHLR